MFSCLILLPWFITADVQPAGARTSKVWHGGSVNQLWNRLDCAAIFKRKRPIHSQETWRYLRRQYRKVVLFVGTRAVGSPSTASLDAFNVKHFAAHTNKGRSIFADEKISKGIEMYSFNQTALFLDGHSYRTFLVSIDAALACDVLQWAYEVRVEDVDGELHQVVAVDLDEGSYCNNGRDAAGNMAYLDAPLAKSKHQYDNVRALVAIRDIQKGEEILCIYSQFNTGSWSHFGL